MSRRGLCDRHCADAVFDPHFGGRGMTYREAAACDSRGGDNLKIVLGLEVRISSSRRQTMASVGVLTRPMPITPRTPGASNVFVAVRVRERLKIWSACWRATAAS